MDTENLDGTPSTDIADACMSSPTPSLNQSSNSPAVPLFINRKTRFINTPNGSYNTGDENTITLTKQFVSTPVGSSCSGPKRMRRDDVRANPFEKHLLEQLHKSAWSPSVFCESMPSGTPPLENWSVDEISLLNPSRIEDSPSTHQDEEVLTPQTEARAQHAISMFFSQHIVPSPSPSPKILPLADEDITSKSPITPISGEASVVDGDSSNTSILRRRKLNFTLSPAGTEPEDENMEINNISPPRGEGELVHSPGFEGVPAISPRFFRGGMKSPNITPIKGD